MQFRRISSALLLAAAASAAWPGDLYVVSGTTIALTPAEVRQVFLGEKRFAGSTQLNPVENSVLQGEFLARVLKIDSSRYEAAWTRKNYREGLTAPPVRFGDEDVLGVIKTTPGAIGYVSKPTGGVKVLQKL